MNTGASSRLDELVESKFLRHSGLSSDNDISFHENIIFVNGKGNC